MSISNQERAIRCKQAIDTYSDDDSYTNLVDFLADAMHYCRLQGRRFRDALDTALMHFEAELSGDEIFDASNNEQTERRMP